MSDFKECFLLLYLLIYFIGFKSLNLNTFFVFKSYFSGELFCFHLREGRFTFLPDLTPVRHWFASLSFSEQKLFIWELSIDGVLAFCHCNKVSQINNLIRRRVYFGSHFQRTHAVVSWPISFGSVVKHYSKKNVVEQNCSLHGEGSKERDRQGLKVPESPSRLHTQWPNFLSSPPLTSSITFQ
jgi:hypothetical protein